MDDAEWHDQIDVNLTGTANAIRAFGPAMVRREGGRMILTSSTQGQHGTKSGATYSTSKWGVIGLMKSAAMDSANTGSPLRLDTRLGVAMIQPQDVAQMLAFLASDEARGLGRAYAVTAGDSANGQS